MSFVLYKANRKHTYYSSNYALAVDYAAGRIFEAVKTPEGEAAERPSHYAPEAPDSPWDVGEGYHATYADNAANKDHTTWTLLEAYDVPAFFKDLFGNKLYFRNQYSNPSRDLPMKPWLATFPSTTIDDVATEWRRVWLPVAEGTRAPVLGQAVTDEASMAKRVKFSLIQVPIPDSVTSNVVATRPGFVSFNGKVYLYSAGETNVNAFSTRSFEGATQIDATSVADENGDLLAASFLIKKDGKWLLENISRNGTSRGEIVEQLEDGSYYISTKADFDKLRERSSDVHLIQEQNQLDTTDTSKYFVVYRVGGPASEIELEQPPTATVPEASGSDAQTPGSERRTRAQLYTALVAAEKFGDRTIRPSKYEENVSLIGYDSFSHIKIPEWAKEMTQGELVSLVTALVAKIMSDKAACDTRVSRAYKDAQDGPSPSNFTQQINIIVGGYGYDH